jgi:hypothetical protein
LGSTGGSSHDDAPERRAASDRTPRIGVTGAAAIAIRRRDGLYRFRKASAAGAINALRSRSP